MKAIISAFVLAVSVAAMGQEVKAKDATFPEERFDKAVDYTTADKPVQEVINDIGEKFSLEIVAQLHPDQLGTKPNLKLTNVTLRKLLVDLAREVSGVWKREGDFIILQPSAKKFSVPTPLGPGGLKANKADMQKFIGSFTDQQKALHRQQGYLGWNDLTPEQQEHLKSINPHWGEEGNHMAMKFRSPEFGDLTIKFGDDQ